MQQCQGLGNGHLRVACQAAAEAVAPERQRHAGVSSDYAQRRSSAPPNGEFDRSSKLRSAGKIPVSVGRGIVYALTLPEADAGTEPVAGLTISLRINACRASDNEYDGQDA